MNLIKLIKGFFHNSRNIVNDEVQGQNLSDVPIQQNLSVSSAIDDALLSNDVSTEESANLRPEIVLDEQSTDELKSIVSELENEAGVETDAKTCIDDKLEDEADAPQPCEHTLLDDTAYMALAEKCCDIISELETIQTEENADMSDLVKTRIKEALLCSGAEPISDETSFDILRHKTEGKSIVRKGTPLSTTVEPGIAIGDKVMIKAIVKIKRKD